MVNTSRRLAVLAGIAVTLAGGTLASAPAATADDGRDRSTGPRTVQVTGEQFSIPGTPHFTMEGDLVGDWYYYPQIVLHDVPSLYSEAGDEVFIGCLDGNHDGDCNDRRDLKGELHTVFLTWASFTTDRGGDRSTLIKGRCVHPVTGGRGAFQGSRGVVDMVDRLDDGVVKTRYSGELVLNAVAEDATAPHPPPTLATRATAAPSARAGC
ncbi:MAG TPA: hypothetical protein VIT42_07410 [Microlunatus sp.]